MSTDVIDTVPGATSSDPWVRDLVDRIDSGEGDVNDLGRLALRLADLGDEQEACKVFARIPMDSATHETVAERLGLTPIVIPAHSGALSDAMAFAWRPSGLAVIFAAGVVPTLGAIAASLAGETLATFIWVLLANAMLVFAWPALESLALEAPGAKLRRRLRAAFQSARVDWQDHVVWIGLATAPALGAGLALPMAGMVLLVTGLATFAAIALTPVGDLTGRLALLRALRRRESSEVWLAASVGALWGLGALAGLLLARTGPLGIAAASAIFFYCASLCSRLTTGGRLRIATNV